MIYTNKKKITKIILKKAHFLVNMYLYLNLTVKLIQIQNGI